MKFQLPLRTNSLLQVVPATAANHSAGNVSVCACACLVLVEVSEIYGSRCQKSGKNQEEKKGTNNKTGQKPPPPHALAPNPRGSKTAFVRLPRSFSPASSCSILASPAWRLPRRAASSGRRARVLGCLRGNPRRIDPAAPFWSWRKETVMYRRNKEIGMPRKGCDSCWRRVPSWAGLKGKPKGALFCTWQRLALEQGEV